MPGGKKLETHTCNSRHVREGRRDGTYDRGLSRRSLRVKPPTS